MPIYVQEELVSTFLGGDATIIDQTCVHAELRDRPDSADVLKEGPFTHAHKQANTHTLVHAHTHTHTHTLSITHTKGSSPALQWRLLLQMMPLVSRKVGAWMHPEPAGWALIMLQKEWGLDQRPEGVRLIQAMCFNARLYLKASRGCRA